MAFKFVILAALVAVANAGVIGSPLGYAGYGAPAYAAPAYAAPAYAAPAYAKVAAPLAYAAPAYAKVAAPLAYAAPVVKAIDTDFDPNPQYSYAYDIQDALTGDVKSQHESRQGENVQGSYSFIESDGTRRTVDYTADDVNGFNAVVRKEPLVQKAIVAAPAYAKVAAPLAYAAPAYAKVAAPLAYAAPAYAAPAYAQAAPLGYAAPAYGKAYLG